MNETLVVFFAAVFLFGFWVLPSLAQDMDDITLPPEPKKGPRPKLVIHKARRTGRDNYSIEVGAVEQTVTHDIIVDGTFDGDWA